MFPVVPDNLQGLSDADLQDLLNQFAALAQEFAARQPDQLDADTVASMNELAELSAPVTAERQRRLAVAASQAAMGDLAQLAHVEPEAPTPEPEVPAVPAEEPVAPAAVVAAQPQAPRVAEVAQQQPAAPAAPAPALRTSASMVAAADVPGFVTGGALTGFGQAAKAVQARLDAYGSMKTSRIAKTSKKSVGPIDVTSVNDVHRSGVFQGPAQHRMNRYSRHGAVQFRREFPDELKLSSDNGGEYNIRALERISSEKRLTGGSLVAALEAEVKQTGNLLAAVGWCAPSETIYDLCEQESMDGMLSVPEVTADRGGFNIPIGGGIDFSTIFTSIGNAGDTHLTEAEVAIPTEKVCTEIPCPDFEDIRLGVDYLCLTGGLLQRRGYPEVVQRFSRGAMIALAHKINAGVIAGIEAGSVDGGSMETCLGAGGDDALGALLSAGEAAREDILYRARMPFATSMEMVLPHWILPQLRAAAARRRGVFEMAVSDAEILSFFSIRGLVPRFVYDWQDAFTDGGVGGMGGATPRTALPTSVRFMMYPAGTWVKATADVVNLDTIYDSTLLTTNQYTALFVEDGWAVMQMCPISRVFTVAIDPCGCLCAADSVIESP